MSNPANERIKLTFLLAAAAAIAVAGTALITSDPALAGGACCKKGAAGAQAQASSAGHCATGAKAVGNATSARTADYNCSIPAGCLPANCPTGASAGCCPGKGAAGASAGMAAGSPMCGGASASMCAGKSAALRSIDLTEAERKVADHVVAAYRADGRHAFTAREIEDKTGVELTAEMKGRVLGAAYGELLTGAAPAVAAIAPLMGCEACPSGGDVVLSTPGELALIQTELAQDGVALAGFEAPDFALRDLDGRKVRKESFAGKAVALAFWSPTCEHSLQNLLHLQAAGAAGGDDVAVVAVACSDHDRKELRKFATSEGLDLPVYVSERGDLREAYQAHVVPTVVLINREGELVKRLVGVKSQTDLATELASLGG